MSDNAANTPSEDSAPDDAAPPASPAPPAAPPVAPPAPPVAPAAPAYAPPAGYAAPAAAQQAPSAYPPPPYGAPAYPYPPAQKTNVLSILSLIASIAGLVWILPVVGSVAGVIMGHISLHQLKTSGEKGRGMAIAGTIIGWIGVGFGVLGVVAIIVSITLAAAARSSYGYYS